MGHRSPIPKTGSVAFELSFSRNVSYLSKWHLRGVILRVRGNMGVLRIDRVIAYHYGDYVIWAENDYGGWPEGDLRCRMVPKGKRHLLRFFSLSNRLTNPVSALII